MQAVCALYASGRSTGVVLDSGHGVSHTVPIYEGFAIPHAIERMLMGGNDITNYLQALLNKKDYDFHTPKEMDTVTDIKERMCYVVGDYDQATRDSKAQQNVEKEYYLPDGSAVMVGTERFQCAETLFRP